MAWSMPAPGQWNPNVGMPPNMNMGSYTSEQWAAVQQQNWQQWAQWQQQYAQWQTQYGEKYTEQMQVIQSMGGMPPLPPGNAAPPPAPPPPDKPPPPPHENNQPLYGHTPTSSKPTPVPPPGNAPHHNNTGNYTDTNTQPGNNSNWSYAPDTTQQQQISINADALKKLAEEERLFDIQFKKWEEEIQKWKKENVNHPDKQAYKEYEDKFEACRAQLMERRQQMNLKRARLMGTAPQPQAITNTYPAGNIAPAIPPPPKPTSNQTYPSLPTNKQTHFQNNSMDKYSDQGNTQYPRQQYNAHTGYNRSNNNNQNADPQDRFQSYQATNDNNYSSATNANFSAPDNANFLLKSTTGKGIPGLDLVHEGEKLYGAINKKHEVIDISGDQNEVQYQQLAPDYSKISKGINNILGDEKIMNILSMVCGQPGPEPVMPVRAGNIDAANVGPPNTYGSSNQNDPPFGQGNRNPNFTNQQYDNRPFNRQGPNFQGQNQEVNQFPPQNRMYDERQDDMPQEQNNFNRNPQYRGPEMPPINYNGPPRPMPPGRPNMPVVRPPLRPQPQEMPDQQHFKDYPHNPHERRPLRDNNVNPIVTQPPALPIWKEEPLFTPSFIVEYEHKPLRLKARDFIEPVHLFEYDHKSKDSDNRRRDLEREAAELFSRKPRRAEKEFDSGERYGRDYHSRDYERRIPRDDLREDNRYRVPPRDEYDDRRRPDNRYDDRRRDDREKYSRREDFHRDRDAYRDRSRDIRRDDSRDDRQHSKSRERDSRKRALSKESDLSNTSLTKKSKEKDSKPTAGLPKHIVMIDDLLESPGREMRPSKIVIILRGPPGSGKSYLAKLIRDREAEYGGTVRIMSIDDYFMQEGEIEERDPSTGKTVKKPTLKYEYDEKSVETYLNSLKRAFKRSLTDGYFSFLIYDAVNDDLRSYADIWNLSRQSGFQVYICTMELDSKVCHKRNIHNRSLDDIEVICSRFFPTPAHHIQLDATTLLQNAAIPDVEMEDADDEVIMVDPEQTEVESVFASKWEKMDDAVQLARLDGTSKPLRSSHLSMEDYLQLDDWKPNTAKPGKKTVRWADIEERRQQEKMRAIGFVVGQTDWNRMTDPTMGSSALTQTKYIERVRRN